MLRRLLRMAHRPRWALLGVCLSFGALFIAVPSLYADEPSFSKVTIRNQEVMAEVADTRLEKARGLSQRDGLAADHGMLFSYDEAKHHAFWMKGMRFDIDIIWIHEGRIVDIAHTVPYVPEGGPLQRYSPKAPATEILEVRAGYAKTHEWAIGDPVLIAPAEPRSARKDQPTH